jgi:hypothetical protein
MTDTQPNLSEAQADDLIDDACVACGHSMSTHDQIAIRYCNATTAGSAGSSKRGCVCTVRTGTARSDKTAPKGD